MSDLEDQPGSGTHTGYRARRTPRLPKGTIATLVKLILACLIVGGILALLRVDPIALWVGLWHAITQGVRDVFDLGTSGIALFLALLATGAVVVLPIWLVTRLLKLRSR